MLSDFLPTPEWQSQTGVFFLTQPGLNGRLSLFADAIQGIPQFSNGNIVLLPQGEWTPYQLIEEVKKFTRVLLILTGNNGVMESGGNVVENSRDITFSGLRRQFPEIVRNIIGLSSTDIPATDTTINPLHISPIDFSVLMYQYLRLSDFPLPDWIGELYHPSLDEIIRDDTLGEMRQIQLVQKFDSTRHSYLYIDISGRVFAKFLTGESGQKIGKFEYLPMNAQSQVALYDSSGSIFSSQLVLLSSFKK